jgi:hypothetical protein
MTLNFPNHSRSYDAKRNVVRFWGYDSALEVSFLVDVSALCAPDQQSCNVEARSLDAFDAARDRIHEAARMVYSGAHKGTYLLVAADL